MFYRRLYAMMDRNVLHVKYRARFFRLTATFLASPWVLDRKVAIDPPD